MHSNEPAQKKVKQSSNVDVTREDEPIRTPETFVTRDLSNASNACGQVESGGPVKGPDGSKIFTVFVLDVNNRLFATEVTESQQLQSIVQKLAVEGCQGAEPGVLMHCRGHIQQDVSTTVAEANITAGCTISLANPASLTKPDFNGTARWGRSAEMGTLFYELHDLYQAAREDFDSDSMPESIMQKCKRAAEVQQTFLGQINRSLGFDKPIGCVQKLMGILETDCIPVLANMSLPATIPTGRAVVADELHWKAILRLGCIEGHIGVALFGDAGKDPSLRPWLFLILMELTVAYCNPGFRSLWSASEELHTTGAKQLKKLGELLNHVLCRDGNLSVDVLPESCFHPTVQNHIVMHLLKCITGANQVLTQSFDKLKDHVTTMSSSSLNPDDAAFNLDLTRSWTTMIEVFVTLKGKLLNGNEPALLLMLRSYADLMNAVMQCCQAVELFAAACIRLGIAQPTHLTDPYTGQPVSDPTANPYLPAVPQPLRHHLSALLPGLHAMSCAEFTSVSTMVDLSALQHDMVKTFLGLPIAKAALKVADLQPEGALHWAVTSGRQDLQLHLPIELRRQYLHELFPDLSVEANYQEEPDRRQLIVPRDFLDNYTPDVALNALKANVTRGLTIMFEGELGHGSGVTKEWLGMMTQHLFGPKAGIFKQCPHDPATVHPISSHERSQGLPDAPNYMNLAGRLAGLAMCYRFPIGIKLSKCFLKLLTSRQPDLSDFEEVDPQVSSSLQAIASASEQELETMQLTFEPPTGTAFPIDAGTETALGAAVTMANRDNFIACLADHFFNPVEQVAEFFAGLVSVSEWEAWSQSQDDKRLHAGQMLQPLVLDDFSNQLAGDLAPLDVLEWRQYTDASFQYSRAYQDLEWFWEMVTHMGNTQRRELLCFWTSMSTVPAGGFRELSSKLKLQASYDASQGLPTSHTCFFQLNLPHYTSLQDMTAAFNRALQECKGFGFG